MNEVNLRALLDYYLPAFKVGDFESFYKNIEKSELTLKELECFIEKILPHMAVFLELTSVNQVNIASYAIEVLFKIKWDGVVKSEGRQEIIKKLRNLIGLPVSFDNEFTDYKKNNFSDSEFGIDEDNRRNYPEMFGGDNYDPDLDLNEQSDDYWDSRF